MDYIEYFSGLEEEIRNIALQTGKLQSDAFLQVALERIVDFGEIDDFDIIETDYGEDTLPAIQGYYFNLLFGELTVFCNLYTTTSPEKLSNFTASELKSAFNRARRYLRQTIRDSSLNPSADKCDAYRFKVELKNSINSIKKLKFVFLTNKPLSRRYEHSNQGNIDGIETSIGIWDLKRFFEAEKSGQEREDIVVKFEEKPLPALKASSSNDLTSYLVVIPGKTLADIYRTYKSRVLEQNVRSFLQNRSKVNKGIKISIKENPSRFFAYNNGITATAKSAAFNEKGEITQLENLQIVNGGQTTAQVYNASIENLDLSEVSVQMKLNVVSNVSLTNSLVPNIARFANSQNPVSDADLFSNSPFHQRLEELSRRVAPPIINGKAHSEKWFYERSRGQYLNEQNHMTPAQRRDFQKTYPKNKMLTKTDLALIMNSWDKHPNQVSKGAQANFKVFAISATASRNSSEISEQYFKEVVVKSIIFRALRKNIPKQHWYSGFPANIVTYSIAWFAHCMQKSELALNIESMWKLQVSVMELDELLLDIAENVNLHLQAYAGNPTTYAKSEQCWKDMKANFGIVELSPSLSFLIEQSIADELTIKAKKEQNALDDLISEVRLLSLSPESWDRIASFMGNRMSASKANDIKKLKQGELISDFKIRQLTKFVREYQKAGGEITFREDRTFTRGAL